MTIESTPKRESYTGWIVGVGLLLLLAAAVPIGLKLYSPREMVMDLQGDPGGTIIWRFQSGMTTQTGVTNLPVKLVFQARQMEFTAQRTNYTGPLQLNVLVGGASRGSVSMGGTNGGVRFQHRLNGWSISGTP